MCKHTTNGQFAWRYIGGVLRYVTTCLLCKAAIVKKHGQYVEVK